MFGENPSIINTVTSISHRQIHHKLLCYKLSRCSHVLKPVAAVI